MIRRFIRTISAASVCLVVQFGLAVAAGEAGKRMKLEAVELASLPDWQGDNHAEGLSVFASACKELTSSGSGFSRPARLSGRPADWTTVCKGAQRIGSGDPEAARAFFQQHFIALKLNTGSGHFTGYYEPEVLGSLVRTSEYTVPVLKRPDDLVALPAAEATRLGLKYGRIAGGVSRPYFTREEIEQGALAGRGLELAWLKSWEDLFFMQVQGSGRVRLPDGSALRLAYGAKTGLPYTSIGKVLIDKGEMTREQMSMQALRGWLEAHPQEARSVMWLNRSYVFFRKLEGADPELGPVGAQKLPLLPFRSLAADRDFWALGVPVWVSTRIHAEGKSPQSFKRIMVVQDTGSAIRGAERGDIFFGTGDAAGIGAGRQDEKGQIIAIVPRSLAARLLGQHDK